MQGCAREWVQYCASTRLQGCARMGAQYCVPSDLPSGTAKHHFPGGKKQFPFWEKGVLAIKSQSTKGDISFRKSRRRPLFAGTFSPWDPDILSLILVDHIEDRMTCYEKKNTKNYPFLRRGMEQSSVQSRGRRNETRGVHQEHCSQWSGQDL